MASKKGLPDVGVLPSSGGEKVEKTGIQDSGYLDKKGTPSGESAHFNAMPPGMNIEDQKVADIRPQALKNYSGGMSYPGDGWWVVGRIVQEKFEVRPAEAAESEHGWASDKSARQSKRELQTRARSGRYEAVVGDAYNCLPPGMNIADQELAEINPEPMAAGNLGNGTQVTTDVTPTSLRTGFDRKALRPTDDMYTREHNDAFYDTVKVDGVEGYVERNNMLDRL